MFAPQQAVDQYHAHGYSVLALTDHNKVTYPWTAFETLNANYTNRDSSALGMLAVCGNELSNHHHTLSLFSDYTTAGSILETSLTNLDTCSEAARSVLCHPAMHWPSTFGPTRGFKISLVPAFRALTLGDFTLEGGFRTTDTGRNILMGNYSGSYSGALNLELHTGNRVRLYIQPPTGSGSTLDLFAAPDADTRDGRWRHLAGVRIGTAVFLYLDGAEVARTNDTAGAFSLQGATFYLGRDSRTDATVFNGDLAPLRIWSRGLTADEVARLATEGRSAPVAPTNGLLACYALEESTFARDTAGNAAGPFDAKSTVFSSLMRSFDVADALQSTGRSSAAANFNFTVSSPTEVPAAAVAYYAGLYRCHNHLRGMEVVNGTRPLTEYALDRELWDALLTELMPTRPVWGFADDDMHSAAQLCRDSECFFASHLTEAAFRQAMDVGAFTFSTTRIRPANGDDQVEPPRVERIAHDGATGTISLSAVSGSEPLPESAYAWVSGGKTMGTGTNFCYRTSALTGAYIRVEITGPGGTTYTNPFGFQNVGTTADTDGDGLPDWWEWSYFDDSTSAVPATVSASGMTMAEHYPDFRYSRGILM